MRRIPLVLAFASTLLLGGCDWWGAPAPEAQLPAAPAAMPAEPPPVTSCNCPAPIRGSEAESGIYRHRAHRYASGYAESEHYAQSSVDLYGYSSSSHVEEGYVGGACCESGGTYGGSARMWVDGYDRRHVYDESAARYYGHQARMRREETGARLDPWHGYHHRWDW
jgi:hypothetical protein